VAYCLGDAAGAWEDARKALELAHKIGAAPAEGRAHQVLGMLFREQGNPAASHACYAEAYRLLRRPGRAEFTESLAGLATAELALGQLEAAHAHAAEIVAYLGGGGYLFADQKPFWTYLTCYRVLVAAGDPRAAEILGRAYSQLQEWAARCPDEATRRSLLENVPWHREIAREWQLAHPGEEGEG
jgi:tetratricopeptide (TPR) repeat protein